MSKYNHIIGILNKCDYYELCTCDMLKQEIKDREQNNAYASKYAPVFIEKVWSMRDYLDRRKTTNLTRFNFCPYCGEKIDWCNLRKEVQHE